MPVIREGIVRHHSPWPVDEVVKHLLALLREKGITVFTMIDHSGEAAKVGIDMPNTKLVIFGNPRAGTPVMLAAPESALDLPLKILIAEDFTGTTNVSFNDPNYLQSRFGLDPGLMPAIEGFRQIVASIVNQQETPAG
jgi:uncharacterized protein (DUF302 family)